MTIKKSSILQFNMNKNILQSYTITTAKYKYTVYEKRILYQIVNMVDMYRIGKKLDKGFNIEDDGNKDKKFIIPVSVLRINKKDANYDRIKKACKSLLGKIVEYKKGKRWGAFSLIISPFTPDFKGYISFTLHKTIYEMLYDVTKNKGFRKYELETAISLKSIYSMRFYELFSEQKKTLICSIENLKSMFKIDNKYKKINDFIKNVIIPAQKELNKSAPYSFTFTPIKTGKKITALTFTPVYHAKNRNKTLEAKSLQTKIDLYWSISEKSKTVLQDEYNFTTTELKRHAKLWERVEKELNLPIELVKIKEKALKAINPKGYIIASLKNMIKVSENTKNYITPKFVKKQTRKTKKINSNSIVDIEPILETKNEVHPPNKDNISAIENINDNTSSSTNEKINSNEIIDNTFENVVETKKELMNQIKSLNKKIIDIEKQIDKIKSTDFIKEGKGNEVLNETIVETNKVDNEQPKTETLDTQTKNNIYDNKPAFSFLQNISKWIIGQFKRK